MPLDADQKLQLFESAFQTYGDDLWTFAADSKMTKKMVQSDDLFLQV